MAGSLLDFTRPDDDALAAWYQRPTEEIQRAQQLAEAARFADLGTQARQVDDGTPSSGPATIDPRISLPASVDPTTPPYRYSTYDPLAGGVPGSSPGAIGDVQAARAALERGLQQRAAVIGGRLWTGDAPNLQLAANGGICVSRGVSFREP